MSLETAFDHHFPSLHVNFALSVPTPGVTALFGPSGCGKSTIIMAVAGLLRPTTSRIILDGVTLADTAAGIWMPPERRRIGLVFQDSRLFPHMTVRRNLEFGRRRAGGGPIGFADIVELLGIGHLLERRPRSLSGGERQRVAIGRALLAQPALLAMDEPLASLDAPRKAEILPFLARLKTALKLPILYVTHSIEELASLADTLVLLERGQVRASGPLAEMLTRSDLPFAMRQDAGMVLSMVVEAHDASRQLSRLRGDGMSLLISLVDRPVGSALRVRIPAREVIVATAPPGLTSVHNVIHGRVSAITLDADRLSAIVEITVAGGNALLARITPDAVEQLGLSVDGTAVAMVKSVSVEALAS